MLKADADEMHSMTSRFLSLPRLPLIGLALGLLGIAVTAHAPVARGASAYPWHADGVGAADTLASRIPAQQGFERVPAADGSFAAWLRGLPMKPDGAPVLTYTGKPKWRQDVHAAVIDIDVGKRDLQQCADAIMRLRGEWLYGAGRKTDIAFNDTDGKRRAFSRQSRQDYPAFRKYMDLVFAYAGTYSLERELKPVPLADMAIGDVFIKGGFPGHAVLVADMAVNKSTGETRFLLIQSYMPAQEMHVLKAPQSPDAGPWYSVGDIGDQLVTPEWVFAKTALRRWP
jgi:hypothetical protein